MNGIIVRVTAYHGDPQYLGSIPRRASVSADTLVVERDIVNDIDNEVVLDLTRKDKESDYSLDALIADFEDEYGSKVNYENGGKVEDDVKVYTFDMFEPSWIEKEEAEDALEDLAERLVDWIQGYPTGR